MALIGTALTFRQNDITGFIEIPLTVFNKDGLLTNDEMDTNFALLYNDVKSRLSLTGGTLTGLLIGTDISLSGDLAVNGGDITTTATTFNLVNSTATTINFGGGATGSLNIGSATGVVNIGSGQLYKTGSGQVIIGSQSNFGFLSNSIVTRSSAGGPVQHLVDTSGVGGGGRGAALHFATVTNDTGPVYSDVVAISGLKVNGTQGDSTGIFSVALNTGAGLATRLSLSLAALQYSGNLRGSSGGSSWFTFDAGSTAASFGGFLKGGTATAVGYLGTDGGGILGGGTGDNFGIRAENNLLLLSQAGSNSAVLSGSGLTVNPGRIVMGLAANNHLGSSSGQNSTGTHNNFFGISSGFNNTGSYNNFIGRSSGQFNGSGSHNNSLGNYAGRCNSTGSHNNFIGRYSGSGNTSGSYNNFIGNSAGRNNTTGSCNNFIGRFTGISNTTGNENNFIGYYSGLTNVDGRGNSFFGSRSGRCNVSGSYNVSMGYYAIGGAGGIFDTSLGATFASNCNVTIGAFSGSGPNITTNTIIKRNTLIGAKSGFSGIYSPLPSGIGTVTDNTAVGFYSNRGFNSEKSVSVGSYAGSGPLYVQFFVDPTYNTCGYTGVPGLNNISLGFSSGSGAQFDTLVLVGGGNPRTGSNNFFVGSYAGAKNKIGSNNVFIGECSGYNNTFDVATAGNYYTDPFSGNNNIFIGKNSGSNNTCGNSNNFLGFYSGRQNTTGSFNNFLGFSTGRSNTSGINNNFLGFYSGLNNTTGMNNNFLGYYSGRSNTTGINNNFLGSYSGRTNTAGNNNNFLGFYSGSANTTGSNNNFFGRYAGRVNTTGSNNFFAGGYSGFSNTTGTDNFFVGACSGRANTTGSHNNFLGRCSGFGSTAGSNNNFIGFYTGRVNTTGNYNNFFGRSSGRGNTSGSMNNFFGISSGFSNTTGSYNNFFGRSSGFLNTTGQSNNFIGRYAGYFNSSGNNNDFLGRSAGCCNTTGCYNTFIGYYAARNNTTAINNIAIGNHSGTTGFTPSGLVALTTQSNFIVMGNANHICALIQVAWTTVSDCRDKCIYGTVPHGKDFLSGITPIEYAFKERGTNELVDAPTKRRYGFSAQNVLEAEGTTPVIVSTEDPDNLKLTSEYMIPILVNAVKELTAEVNDLRSRVQILESK